MNMSYMLDMCVTSFVYDYHAHHISSHFSVAKVSIGVGISQI